ncbi:MAG: serine/threonine-protein kinase [Cyanobacteria bacterium J06632_22]
MIALTPKHRRSNYRILGLVGHGQFGRVYCAVHRKTGHMVAIKQLNRHGLPTHAFLQELHCLLRLNHPNIVTCEALEHTDRGRQLILEYCEGGTLRSLMNSTPKPDMLPVLSLSMQMVGGLANAHEQGIIHCDIKPENILLQYRQGQPIAKISDFGIAKVAQNLKTVSSGQTGSPAYMAPERFYKQFSPASDVYALGILLYELIAGHRPFAGTPGDLMSAHLNQPVPVPEQLTGPLKTIVLTALEKIPARRYPSAVEMLSALQNVEVPPPSPLPLFDPMDLVHQPFVGAAVTPLTTPVEQLLVCPTQPAVLMARSQHQVTLYHPETLLETAVLDAVARTTGLYGTAHGPCLTTESGLYAVECAPQLGLRGLKPLVRWSADTLGLPASSGRWYGAVNAQQLTLGALHRQQQWVHPTDSPWSQTPLPFPLTGTLEAVLRADAQHWVIVERQQQTLKLHIVARRGLYLGALPVELPLYQLRTTEEPYRLLAIAPDIPSLVLIDLKPFRVMHIGLEIVPHRAAAMPWGYVLLSQAGELLVLDRETAPIGCIEVPAQGTALLPTSPHGLLLANWTGEAGGLYPIDLRQFDLDILF